MPESIPIPDRDLMLTVAAGDLENLDPLFRRWHRETYALCARLAGPGDAEDLVHEAFLRVLRYRHTYRGDEFRPWLMRIARNVCLDHLRGRSRARMMGEALSEEVEAGDLQARAGSESDERLAKLDRALRALPHAQREVIVLVRHHGLSYEQAAKVLECSPGAARVRMHRAIEKLRGLYERLEREDHELRNRA